MLNRLRKMPGFGLPPWLNWKSVLWASVGFALLSCLIAIGFNYMPSRDMATRYVPMVEAFVDGDWRYAFHPRVPPLQVVCGALTAWIGRCDGFTALKLVSSFWHIGSVFLVFILFQAVYKDRKMLPALAALCCAFYPYAFHMAYSGLRESAKIFILLLIAYALVRIRDNVKQIGGYILLGLGCGLGAVNRQEMIPIACCCLFFGAVEESFSGKFPRKIFISLLISAVFPIINTLINWFLFQTPMPDCRLEQLYVELFGTKPGVSVFFLVLAGVTVLIPPAGFLAVKLCRRMHYAWFFGLALLFTVITSLWMLKVDPNADLWDYLDSVSKGFYRFAGGFAFLSTIYLICRNRLSRSELWVLAVALAAAVLSIAMIHVIDRSLFVSSRYLFTGMPLLFGVLLVGIGELFDLIVRFIGKLPAQILSILLIGGAVYGLTTHMTQPLWRLHKRKHNIAMRAIMNDLADVLKKDYKGAPVRNVEYYPLVYNSRKAPKVYFADDDKVCILSYWAGGSPALYYKEADYYIGPGNPPPGKKCTLIGEVATPDAPFMVWRVEK